ncbi:MAG: O-antigen ligase family protein [Ignavibacteriaceae bacterium]
MFIKIVKVLLTLAICLLFGTVFIVSPELVNGFYTGKTYYFYTVSILIIILLMIYFILNKKVSFNFLVNKIDIILLFLLLYSFTRLLFTEGIPIYNDRIISYILLIIIYFLFKQIFSNQNSETPNIISILLIFSFLTSGFFEGLIGLFQTYKLFEFGESSIQFYPKGSFENHAPYAGYLVTILPFAFGISQLNLENHIANKALKKYSILIFLTILSVLPLTQTRGSWIAALAGISFVLVVKYKLIEKFSLLLNRNWKKIVTLLTISGLLIFLFLLLYSIRPASAFGRLLIYKISFNMILDHPFFGMGFDKFSTEYNNYQADYFGNNDVSDFEITVADNIKECHNDFIENTVEFGLVGLILLIFLLMNLLKIPKQKKHTPLIISSQASIVALLCSSFFSYSLQILPNLLHFIFLSAIISGGYSTISDNFYNLHSYSRKISIPLFLYAIILVILTLFISSQINKYNSEFRWKTAVMYSKNKLYKEAISIYEELYPDKKYSGPFLMNYGGTLTHFGSHRKAIDILNECKKLNPEPNVYIALGISFDALNDYELSKASFTKASLIKPNSYYPKYLLANLHKKYGRIPEAKKIATEILLMKTKVPSYAVEQIKLSMKKLLDE